MQLTIFMSVLNTICVGSVYCFLVRLLTQVCYFFSSNKTVITFVKALRMILSHVSLMRSTETPDLKITINRNSYHLANLPSSGISAKVLLKAVEQVTGIPANALFQQESN